MSAAVSFARDILPLFTQADIDHMEEMGVLLNDHAYMSKPKNAEAVYDTLEAKTMPPTWGGGTGPWSDEQIALFKAWMDGGYQP